MREERIDDSSVATIRMHRFILGLEKGNPLNVDHINHDTLDNRRSNLRIATCSQNSMNRKKYRNNSTGFKGVSFYKRHNNFMAQINVNGKRLHLGYRDTARKAYEELYVPDALKYHGEFARLA